MMNSRRRRRRRNPPLNPRRGQVTRFPIKTRVRGSWLRGTRRPRSRPREPQRNNVRVRSTRESNPGGTNNDLSKSVNHFLKGDGRAAMASFGSVMRRTKEKAAVAMVQAKEKIKTRMSVQWRR